MKLQLSPVNANDTADSERFIKFVNAHYASELPVSLKTLTHPDYRFFWAHASGNATPVGVTGYKIKTPFLAESIKSVLHPSSRGKGLGPALSQAIEDEVRRAGFKKIMSTILIDNLPMLFIKLKQGFIIEGTHFDHEKPGLHEYSLGKTLD